MSSLAFHQNTRIHDQIKALHISSKLYRKSNNSMQERVDFNRRLERLLADCTPNDHTDNVSLKEQLCSAVQNATTDLHTEIESIAAKLTGKEERLRFLESEFTHVLKQNLMEVIDMNKELENRRIEDSGPVAYECDWVL